MYFMCMYISVPMWLDIHGGCEGVVRFVQQLQLPPLPVWWW